MMSEEGEEYDTFDAADGTTGRGNFLLFDSASIAHVNATASAAAAPRQRRPLSSGASRGTRSAATTQLATDVGSTIVRSRIPFLKSFTFFDPKIYYRKEEEEVTAASAAAEGGEEEENGITTGEDGITNTEEINGDDDDDITVEIDNLHHWDIHLQDPPSSSSDETKKLRSKFTQSKLGTILKLNKTPRFIVTDFEGLLEYSSFQSGDFLLSINKHIMDPTRVVPTTSSASTAQDARNFMNECLEKDGVLNIVTENPHGDDILIHVTIIKPRHDMNYDELGLVVWNWPYLCVRQINEGSIFQRTPIQEMDQIAAINDIDCSKMRTKAFAQCVGELPTEITITLIRRKHRYTGSFK
jgi:hypothetical protein